MTTALWISVPFMVILFGLWTGIPLWMVLRHPDKKPTAADRSLPLYLRWRERESTSRPDGAPAADAVRSMAHLARR